MIVSERPPLPPFSHKSAELKTRLAEDAWNSQDANKVSLAYTLKSEWRYRTEFIDGREDIVLYLQRKWSRESEYRLIGNINPTFS